MPESKAFVWTIDIAFLLAWIGVFVSFGLLSLLPGRRVARACLLLGLVTLVGTAWRAYTNLQVGPGRSDVTSLSEWTDLRDGWVIGTSIARFMVWPTLLLVVWSWVEWRRRPATGDAPKEVESQKV